jgi:hypothetical protein
MMQTYNDFSMNLTPGSAWRAAAEYGIDLDQLDSSLSLTPLERLIRHDQALELILAMTQAGIRYYGFDPRFAEAPERA